MALRLNQRLRAITRIREFAIVMIILATALAMSQASPVFLNAGNIFAILLGLSIESIVVIGMTVLLVSGGFDLSVGSTFGFSAAIAAMCLVHGIPVLVCIGAGVGTGMLIGLINGVLISKAGINPFITTLGMMSIVRGLLMIVTGGKNVSGLPGSFTWIGQNKLSLGSSNVGVQYPILIAAVLIILGDFVLRKTRFFRQNYYIGGNEKAAILSGINVDRVKIFNYVLMGALSAFAGILMTARLGSASVTAGTGLELKVISAAVIGGASLQGGEGTILGAVLGALLMALIVNSLTLLGVDVYWNNLVIGSTLLLAVAIDTVAKRKKR